MTERIFVAVYWAFLVTLGLPFVVIGGIVFVAGYLGLRLVRRCAR